MPKMLLEVTKRTGRLLTGPAVLILGLAFGSIIVGLGVLLPDLGLGRDPATVKSFVVGALILCSIFIGASSAQRTAHSGRSGINQRPVVRRLKERILLFGTFMLVALNCISPTLLNASVDHLDRFLIGCPAWLGLGLFLHYLLRRHRACAHAGTTPLLLIAPASLVLSSAVAVVLSPSIRPAIEVLTLPLVVSAVTALILVPALLIFSAVMGLQNMHDGTRRLTRVINRRPLVVPLVLVANVALVVLVWGFGAWLSPATKLWGATGMAWVASVGCGLLVLILLTGERRVSWAITDQSKVASTAAVWVAGLVATLVVVIFGTELLSLAVMRPVFLACLLALPLVVTAWNRLFRRWVPTLLSLGGVSVLFAYLGSIPPRASPITRPLTSLTQKLSAHLGVVLLIVLGLLIISTIVGAFLFDRVRLLVYLAAVGIWLLVTTLIRKHTDATELNIDIALTAMLMLATLLWLFRRQDIIDGYEIVLTSVVTALLWLVPLAISLVPSPVGEWIVAGALVIPAGTSIWTYLRDLSQGGAAMPEDGKLGLACLAYGLLAALVWAIGQRQVDVIDGMGTLFQGYLSFPLAMLLILAASSRRSTTELMQPYTQIRRQLGK